ncbi:uncharacterized protein [Musca autumnalis]|uniref:uncharacterized protein n=1 Tax=Musca autumnalis TaxID=221902 RepID=UPI003CF157CF
MDTLYGTKSDMDIKTLLASWQLEHLHNHFLEQKITLKVLKILQPKHVDKLFANRPVGDHAMFEYRLAIWNQLQLLNEPTAAAFSKPLGDPTSNATISRSVQRFQHNSGSSSSTHNKEVSDNTMDDDEEDDYDDDNDDIELNLQQVMVNKPKRPPTARRSSKFSAATMPTCSQQVAQTPPPQPSSTQPSSHILTSINCGHTTYPIGVLPPRYNVRAILNACTEAKAIYRYYEQHNILKEEHRISLINIIAQYIESVGGSITLSEGTHIENQILEIFPTEKEEYYRTGKRGRLYNKIFNMRRNNKRKSNGNLLKNLSEPPSPDNNSSNCELKEEFIEEILDNVDLEHIDDVRANITNDEERMQFWQRYQLPRFKDIDNIEVLQGILDKWPEYKLPNAREYIHNDFSAKYPRATKFSEIFFTKFKKLENVIFDKVIKTSVTYKTMQSYMNCTKESKHLLLLWALHQLIPPTNLVVVDDNGVRRKKRYSIHDSQNSCFFIRKSLAEIESSLATRTTSTPPMLLIVGELAGSIEEVYVYFEDQRYRCQTVVEAAELCMELYFVFNIAFPEESVMYYNFAQTFFLNIQSDVKYPRIYTTINDINACEL